MEDKFGRNINYARLSLTDLCNLRCLYCMPEKGIDKKSHGDFITIENFLEVVDCLSDLGIDKIRLTGGEPLLKKGIEKLIEGIGARDKIKSKCITTNAIFLPKYIKILKENNFNNINISLDSLDPIKYEKITRGGNLQDALIGIQCAVSNFDNVKINCVMMKDINDDEFFDMIKFAKQNNIKLRFIELMPFSYQKDFFDKHYISLESIIEKARLQHKVERIDNGKEKEILYKIDKLYTVGFIMTMSNCFCDSCNRIRILSDGKLLTCLHGDRTYDFKPYLGNQKALNDYLKCSIYEKQKENQLNCGVYQNDYMKDIGG